MSVASAPKLSDSRKRLQDSREGIVMQDHCVGKPRNAVILTLLPTARIRQAHRVLEEDRCKLVKGLINALLLEAVIVGLIYAAIKVIR
jgi:hypothetical protein